MSSARKADRVVVTGMGAVTAIGQTVPQLWAAMRELRSGVAPVDARFEDPLRARLAAEVRGFDQRARLKHFARDKIILYSDRYAWFAAAAADEAIRQAGLAVPVAAPGRTACFIGSALGGQATVETASRDHYLRQVKATHPLTLVRMIASSAAGHVGIEFGIKGPVIGLESACATSEQAIALGRDYIRRGLVDVAIVGGTETPVAYGILMAMQSAGLLSPDACRPFSRRRNGAVVGEGAGVLVLESEAHAHRRGARILAEVAGVGLTNGHSGAEGEAPDSEARTEAMRQALADADVSPDAVDWVNAHGLGTTADDASELTALAATFGQRARPVPVSATKPMHGYAVAATGAIEAIACIKAMEEAWVPPTLGLDEPETAAGLDLVGGSGRQGPVRYAMSNAFALNGICASLVLAAPGG